MADWHGEYDPDDLLAGLVPEALEQAEYLAEETAEPNAGQSSGIGCGSTPVLATRPYHFALDFGVRFCVS